MQISICLFLRITLQSQTHNYLYLFSSTRPFPIMCAFISSLCVHIWVKAKRWVATWLLPFSWWITDSDVSARMNNAHFLPLPLLLLHPFSPHLFSTSCLQPFSSLLFITATSEGIIAFPFFPLLPFLVSSLMQSRILMPSSRCPLVNPAPTANSFFPWSFTETLLLHTKMLIRSFFPNKKNSKMMIYAVHYSIIGQGREAIDTVWQFCPWLTGAIRGLQLTDKRPDNAGAKLTNQNLEKEEGITSFEVCN